MSTITDRIDAITEIPVEYRTPTPPCPRSVKIELTGRCNFRCAFCARAQQLREVSDIDRGFFERILPEMRQAGVEEIGLFYLGESFMLRWLPEAVKFAKHDAGFPYVFLTTNGSLSTPDRMRAVMQNGLDSLKFSLNYADEEQFNGIARVNSAHYHRMLNHIKAAKAIRDEVYETTGNRCGLYASYILYDGDQGEKMNEVVEELSPYLDEIYSLPLYNQADLVTEEEEDRNWSVTAGNRGRVGALREPIPCWAVFTEGHITFDGKLSACCFDHDGSFHMGDLNTTPFMEAWHSEKFRSLRDANLRKDVTGTPCESCAAYS